MATTIITKYGSGAPTASDVVRGELAVDTENGRLYTENIAGSVVELGTNPAANVTFGDNVKAIFGAGSDLQIYHDGSHSRIDDAGTGKLILRGNDAVEIHKYTGEYMITAVADGAVTLYHDDSAKLATTSTGIDVTGTVTADGLTVDGSGTAVFSGGQYIQVDGDGASATDLEPVLWARSQVGASIPQMNVQGDQWQFGGGGTLDTTPTMTIDYGSNTVGIGTTTPDRAIKIEQDNAYVWIADAAGGNVGFIGGSGSNDGLMRLYEGTGHTAKVEIHSNADSYFNGGNVGIGTSSPSSFAANASNLVVGSGSGTEGITINSGTANYGVIYFADGTSGSAAYAGNINYNHADNSMRLGTNGSTTSVVITSSGELLVAKTGLDTAVAGTEIRPNLVAITSAGDTPLYLRRNTNDGELINFKQGTTPVGSIGTETSNSDLYIGNGDTAIMFHDGVDAIFPHNASTNASRDAAIDIGYSTYRFKDLYLSGRARAAGSTGFPAFASVTDTDTGMNPDGAGNIQFSLQGAEVARFDGDGLKMASGKGIKFDAYASGNVLDDYEEGTFTAAISCGSGTITLESSANLLSYTKIGRLVHIQGSLNVDSVSSPSGSFRITGLPFAMDTGIGEGADISAASAALYNMASDVSGLLNTEVSVDGVNTTILIRDGGGTAAGVNNIANKFDGDSIVRLSLTYHTTS